MLFGEVTDEVYWHLLTHRGRELVFCDTV